MEMEGRPLNIAMLAPPWIPVPPPGYGGVEHVIELLAAELVSMGHRMTLFAAPGSESLADVGPVLERTHPDEIQTAIFETDHAAHAFDQIDQAAASGDPFDIVHDHSGFTAFAFANRLDTPMVHTLHGPFTDDTGPFYERHSQKAYAIAISDYQRQHAPRGLRVVAVVPNPIVVDAFPFQAEKEDYLLWIGRLNAEKGPQRAITAAREADMRLLLAGPVQPGDEPFFQSEVKPHIDDDRVRYVGEVGDEKKELFARAAALLMPIRWPEPFGLVMTEAMACGTPVIAYPEGAAPEIVVDGETGFVVNSEMEMADGIKRLHSIDPHRCRESASERFDVAVVAAAYEDAFREVIALGERDTEAAHPAPADG